MVRLLRPNRIYLVIPLIVLGVASCGGGFPAATPAYNVLVSPSSIIVAAGSTTTFTALFTPSRPGEGSLTWSVTPATGGTITSAGSYLAAGPAGNYTVVATWTPSHPLSGGILSGSAAVEVLASPQPGTELNPDLIQASGAIQMSGAIQNAAVVGQFVPSVISTDLNDTLEVRSGFILPLPAACLKSARGC